MRSSLRTCAALASCVTVSLCVSISAARGGESPVESFNSPDGSLNGPYRPGDSGQQPDKKFRAGLEKAKWNKLATDFEKRLGRMAVRAPHKKSLDDYWIVGTAELSLATQNADIRFDAKQGQRATAEFLAEYMFEFPKDTRRLCDVFGRLKTSEAADQALAAIRQRYDAMSQYREEIAQRYNARTTRRC